MNYKKNEYVSGQTKHLRDSDNLLSSYQIPYGAVTPGTISRWIKTVLATSCIDTAVYSMNSTRAASPSPAIAQGCLIVRFLKWGGQKRRHIHNFIIKLLKKIRYVMLIRKCWKLLQIIDSYK